MKALEVMFVIPSVSIDFIDVTLVSDDTYGDDEDVKSTFYHISKNHVPVFCILYISLFYETNVNLLCDTFAGEEAEQGKRWSLSDRSTHSFPFVLPIFVQIYGRVD